MQVSQLFFVTPKDLDLSQKVVRICCLAEVKWRELHFCT